MEGRRATEQIASVVCQLRACPRAAIDTFIRQGLYRDRPGLPQPPYVPGLEVAGTVRALGEGVVGFEAGEPVVTLSANSGTGGYAAIFVSDAAYVASLKDVNLDPALAVAVVPNGATAHLALSKIARIREGERSWSMGP
jgi:NADPH2:quinone reductase